MQRIRYLHEISCVCWFFQWCVVLWNFIPSEHTFLCGFFVSNSLERCNCENNYWHNIKPLNTVSVGEILSTLGLGNKGPIQAWAGGTFQRKKRSFDWLSCLLGLSVGNMLNIPHLQTFTNEACLFFYSIDFKLSFTFATFLSCLLTVVSRWYT